MKAMMGRPKTAASKIVAVAPAKDAVSADKRPAAIKVFNVVIITGDGIKDVTHTPVISEDAFTVGLLLDLTLTKTQTTHMSVSKT